MATTHLEHTDLGQCPGRVGPNAVIQLASALHDIAGSCMMRRVFRAAGQRNLLDNLPYEMIDERVAAALFTALWRTLPDWVAEDVAGDAGQRTADYILTHRIPGFAKSIIGSLPPSLAGSLLLSAIQKNAWTFAGSGHCRTTHGKPSLIEITANPLAMPNCAWHQAVFERLFRVLVSKRTCVSHPKCCAESDSVCRFEVHLA